VVAGTNAGANAEVGAENEDDDDLPPLSPVSGVPGAQNYYVNQTSQQIANIINTLQSATGGHHHNSEYITLAGLGDLTNIMQAFVYSAPTPVQFITHAQLATLNNLNLGDDIKVTLTSAELNAQMIETYRDYLKTKEYQANQFKSDICNICLDNFKRYDKIMILSGCRHYYHSKCIRRWLTKESNKCPVCKTEVAPGKPNIADNEEVD
jgi:hypothetical protein